MELMYKIGRRMGEDLEVDNIYEAPKRDILKACQVSTYTHPANVAY